MVNNFELIRNLLDFETEDDFYFVQIFKRRKDNPSLNTDVVVIKEYFINSLDYLNKKYDDIIEVAIKNNARVTIRLNKRSYKKIALKMLIDIVTKIEQGQYQSVKNSFSSCSGKYSSDKNKTWIIDVDAEDLLKYDMNDVIQTINDSSTLDEKVICKIPSKTGYHLLVKPFDLRLFTFRFPTLNIQKDNPTNLYIP